MKKLNLVFFCVVVLLTTTEGLAQGALNWNQKTTIPVHKTSNDPGVTTAFGRLWVSFAGTDSNRTVNALSSANGVTFDGGPGPLIGKRSEYGVRIAYNPNCNSLFLTYVGRDSNKTVNITQSLNGGATWPSQIVVGPATVTSVNTDSPTITLLDNGNMGLTWGTSFCNGGVCTNRTELREVNCNLTVPVQGCFFDGTCESILGITTFTGTPGWVGAGDLRAIAGPGSTSLKFKFGPSGAPFTIWGNGATEGPSLTVNPGGSYYVAWRGAGNRIYVGNVSTGAQLIAPASDTTTSAPAITVFNGQLFVVWRTSNNSINVASTNLF